MIEIARHAGALVLRITEPQLQMYLIPQFKAAVAAQLVEKPQLLIFDLGAVQHIDSSAMGALFHFQKELATWGGRLRLANLTSKVQQIFKVTRSENAFDIRSNIDEALKR